MMKMKMKLSALILALVMLVSALPLGVFAASVDLEPVADAYVSVKNPDQNFGDADELLISGSTANEKIAYVSYDGRYLATDSLCTLSIPVKTGDSQVSVYLFDDYVIEENSLTYENRPALSSGEFVGTAAVENGEINIALPSGISGRFFTLALVGERVGDYSYALDFDDAPVHYEYASTNLDSGAKPNVIALNSTQATTFSGKTYSPDIMGVTGSTGGVVGVVSAPRTGDEAISFEGNAFVIAAPRRMKFLNVFKSASFTKEDAGRSFVVSFRAASTTADAKIIVGYNTMTGYGPAGSVSYTLTANKWQTYRYAITITEEMINAGQVLFCLEVNKGTVYVDDLYAYEDGNYAENFDNVTVSSGSYLTYEGWTAAMDGNKGKNRIYSPGCFATTGGESGTTMGVESDPTGAGRGNVIATHGRRIMFSNALKGSAFTTDDLDETYIVKFDVWSVDDKEITVGLMSWAAGTGASGDPKSSYRTSIYKGEKKSLKARQWTTVELTVTVDQIMVNQQVGCPAIEGTGAKNTNHEFYVDNLRVIPKGGTEIASGANEGVDAKPTVTIDNAKELLFIDPIGSTYVSKSAPDTANGVCNIKLDGEGDLVGLVAYDISALNGSTAASLTLPALATESTDVSIYAIDAAVDLDTVTYNDYTALGNEIWLGTHDIGRINEIDLSNALTAVTGNSLTLVLKRAGYEQDFTDITGTVYLAGGSGITAEADGSINWGTYTIYYDESNGGYAYRTGNQSASGAASIQTEGEGASANKYLQLKDMPGGGGRVKLHNIIGTRALKQDDLGKTFVISYKVRTTKAAASFTASAYNPENVKDANGTTLHGRTSSIKSTEQTISTTTSWETVTHNVTVTQKMIDGQFGMYTVAYGAIGAVDIDDIVSYSGSGEVTFDASEMVISHVHVYDQQVASGDTLVGPSEKPDMNYYYYTCTCGAKGSEQFEASHVCDIVAATETTPEYCSICGKVTGFPTNTALNSRYTTDGGETWTYAELANAISAVSGKTATVEIYRDVTLSAGLSITGGDVTIKSYDSTDISTVTRGSKFAAPMLTLNGGNLKLENVTWNGASINVSTDGAIIKLATGTATLGQGVTLKNGSCTDYYGGGVYVGLGASLTIDGARIENCTAKRGAGVYLHQGTAASWAILVMTDGVITGCKCSGKFHMGPAIFLDSYSVATITGGQIFGNTSGRYDTGGVANRVQNAKSAADGGAIGIRTASGVKLTIGGDVVFSDNTAKTLIDNKVVSVDLGVYGSDSNTNNAKNSIFIMPDYTGAIKIWYPGEVATDTDYIAKAGTGYTAGTVLPGVIDASSGRVAKITDNGTIVWTEAKAAVMNEGLESRYATLDSALEAAGENTVILLGDVEYTFKGIGDSLSVALNGHKVTFPNNIYSYEETTSTVTTGYPGGSSQTVTTYTAKGMGGVIENASLTLGSDLTLYIYATLLGDLTDAKLMVTRGETSVVLDPEAYGSTFRYRYTGINPQCMGDELVFELFKDINDNDVIDADESLDVYNENYTVKTYCDTLLAMSAEQLGMQSWKADALKALIRDLLVYGGAAQTYTGYNKDALVSDGITGSAFVKPDDNKVLGTSSSDKVAFSAATVRFSNTNALVFKVKTDDIAKTTLKIGETVYNAEATANADGSYSFVTAPLYATQFGDYIIAELVYDGATVQTLTYGMDSYVAYMADKDTAMGALARATYNYGASAKKFETTDPTEALTEKELAPTGAKLLGSASLSGDAVSLAGVASGAELRFYGKGEKVTFAFTAAAGDRVSITLDDFTIDHVALAAGETSYTLEKKYEEGYHTIRVISEQGAATLNTVKLTGYALAPNAASGLLIEYVGAGATVGEMLYEESETDAAKSFAYLSAKMLDADYRIVKAEGYVAGETPDLVIVENGVTFDSPYAGVPVITVSAEDGATVKLTADTLMGEDGLPSLGGSAVWAADLAKYIKANHADLLPDTVSLADDIIVEVRAKGENEYSSFDVYVKTSDPSDKYYVQYKFEYEYSDDYDNFAKADTQTNRSNYRVKTGFLMEKTESGWNSLKPVLHEGEISAAIKVATPGIGNNVDFVGGFHGDEWLSSVALYANGNPVNLKAEEKTVISCNSLIFDQTTTMYQCATSSSSAATELEKRGTALADHSQHFTITALGINNRQSMDWKLAGTPVAKACFLQMLTVYRKACETVSVYDNSGKLIGRETAPAGNIAKADEKYTPESATQRLCYYDGTTGVTAFGTYQLPAFDDNTAALQMGWVHIRQYGDNKMYMSYTTTNADGKIAVGDKWVTDLYYGFDYAAK